MCERVFISYKQHPESYSNLEMKNQVADGVDFEWKTMKCKQEGNTHTHTQRGQSDCKWFQFDTFGNFHMPIAHSILFGSDKICELPNECFRSCLNILK